MDYFTGAGAMLTRDIKDSLESLERIIGYIRKVLPKMDEEDLRVLLKA